VLFRSQAFSGFRVVPPATGIVHQVNLEFLAQVVLARERAGEVEVFPDTLVGTDSHTTMINGLGVLGWGVGGIEAEAVMLGQPLYFLTPQVVGFRLHGRLREGVTATDLVLTVTEMLRKKGVVDKFVEFYGSGLSQMTLPDRATVANMAPEYGATMGFFPVDGETLRYLRGTGRSEDVVQRVERYSKEQGLFRTDQTPDPEFSDTLELDLGTVEPSLAGPKRPQDRVPLSRMKDSFRKVLTAPVQERGFGLASDDLARSQHDPSGFARFGLAAASQVDAAAFLADVEELQQIRQRELKELPLDPAAVFPSGSALRLVLNSLSDQGLDAARDRLERVRGLFDFRHNAVLVGLMGHLRLARPQDDCRSPAAGRRQIGGVGEIGRATGLGPLAESSPLSRR